MALRPLSAWRSPRDPASALSPEAWARLSDLPAFVGVFFVFN